MNGNRRVSRDPGTGAWIAGFALIAVGAVYAVTSMPLSEIFDRDGTHIDMRTSREIDLSEIYGEYKVRFYDDHLRLRVEISRPGIDWEFAASVPRREFTRGPSEEFELRRGAGIFVLEGLTDLSSTHGSQSGEFRFVENPQYTDALEQLGHGKKAKDLFQLSVFDVDLGYIEAMTRYGGGSWQLNDIIRVLHHGIDVSYAAEMTQAGYAELGAEQLIRLDSHGVPADYLKQVQTAGLEQVETGDMIRLNNHGVDPQLIQALIETGHADLDVDEAVSATTHGVGPDFVRGMFDAGLEQLSVSQLQRLRNHGVAAVYVAGVLDAADRLYQPEELIRLSTHGIEDGFIRLMVEDGHGLSVDELVRRKNSGDR